MLAHRARILSLGLGVTRQARDNHHLPEFQGHGDDLAAKVGQIVFVTLANLLDQMVDPQPGQQAGDLSRVFIGEQGLEGFVGEAGDEKLTAQQGAKQ